MSKFAVGDRVVIIEANDETNGKVYTVAKFYKNGNFVLDGYTGMQFNSFGSPAGRIHTWSRISVAHENSSEAETARRRTFLSRWSYETSRLHRDINRIIGDNELWEKAREAARLVREIRKACES